MSNFKVIISILIVSLISYNLSAQKKILVGGTLSDKIAIINKKTAEIEWQFCGFKDEINQCNSLLHTKEGNIAYTHKNGVNMINPNGEIIFNFQIKDNNVLQSISETKEGFLVGISGSPIQIIELDKSGKLIKEIKYDSGVENKYRQFRQITKSKDNTYLIPIAASKCIVELDNNGKIIKTVSLDYESLYVTTNKKGDWVATTGHAGVIYIIDKKTGLKSTLTDGPNLDNDTKIEFCAGITQLKNGNYLFANWLGHNGDQTQPMFIEIDKNGKVVWEMNKIEGYTFAAGLYPIY